MTAIRERWWLGFVSLSWALSFATPAKAACDPLDLRLYQSTINNNFETVDPTLLATVNPIATAQTVTEFYAYDAGSRSYMGTHLPTAGDTSLVAIHQNSVSCELSLVMVHSAIGQGENFGWAYFYVNGDLHFPLVQDDAELTGLVFHDDEYDSLPNRIRVGYNRVEWAWRKADTDGLAHTFVTGWVGCLTIDPSFRNLLPFVGDIPWGQSIDKWKFVSAGGATTDLALDKRLSICFPGGDPENPGAGPFPVGNCPCIGAVEWPACEFCERNNKCHQHWVCNIYHFAYCKFGIQIPALEVILPASDEYLEACYAAFENVRTRS